MSETAADSSVSVVLPFRDAAGTLAAAIESIRRQSSADFECLLIDDGSTDGSARIAASVATADARFRLLRTGTGLVDSLNAGTAAAHGAWIARMDADDVSHPDRLARQLAAAVANPGVSVVSCLIRCIADGPLRNGMRRYESWLNSLRIPDEIRNAVFVEAPLVHPSVTIRREVLLSVGGYRDTGGPEDYDLWLRLLLGGHRAIKVPEVLLEWRDSPGRLTRVDSRYRADRILETKLRHLPRVIPPGATVQIWGAGPIGKRWGRELLQRGYRLRRYIDIDPRKIGRSARGAPIDSPDALNPADGKLLVAVGTEGARELIEERLASIGLRPWSDYVCVC